MNMQVHVFEYLLFVFLYYIHIFLIFSTYILSDYKNTGCLFIEENVEIRGKTHIRKIT